MKRFFGMMPSSEIEVRKIYDDGLSGHLHMEIDAGPNGWTLRMADGSTRYKDESKGTEKNLAEAEAIAEELFPNMKEIDPPTAYRECCGGSIQSEEIMEDEIVEECCEEDMDEEECVDEWCEEEMASEEDEVMEE